MLFEHYDIMIADFDAPKQCRILPTHPPNVQHHHNNRADDTQQSVARHWDETQPPAVLHLGSRFSAKHRHQHNGVARAENKEKGGEQAMDTSKSHSKLGSIYTRSFDAMK